MNTIKKTTILIALLVTTITHLSAQSYNTAVGFRLGTDWGVSIQQRILSQITLEGIIQKSFSDEDVSVSLLVEQHKRLISKRFNFYIGAGIQKGWTGTLDSLNQGDPFGFPLIAGVEFALRDIVVSYDFKPVINVLGGSPLKVETGLSLRYIFIKRPRSTPIKDKFEDIKENRADRKAAKEKARKKAERKEKWKNIFKRN